MDNIKNRNIEVGRRVQKIREHFNLTQSQLSAIIGSKAEKNGLVRMIEHGERTLTEKNIRLIADALNILPGYLRLETNFMTNMERLKSIMESYDTEQEIRGKYLEMILAENNYSVRYKYMAETFSHFGECIISDSNNDSIVLSKEELVDFMDDFEKHLIFQIQRKINKDKWMREEEKYLFEEESSFMHNPEEDSNG